MRDESWSEEYGVEGRSLMLMVEGGRWIVSIKDVVFLGLVVLDSNQCQHRHVQDATLPSPASLIIRYSRSETQYPN